MTSQSDVRDARFGDPELNLAEEFMTLIEPYEAIDCGVNDDLGFPISGAS